MLKSIAEEITVALASNDIIKTEEMEAYTYGLELLIPKVILYAVIFVISLITNTFLASVTFVVLLMCLRRYTGGFHCKTAETCLLFSLLIYLLSLLGYEFVQNIPTIACGISSIISAVIVLIFAPVEDVNRPLDESEKVQYRQMAMITLTVILMLEMAALLFRFDTVSYLSACSLTANAVLIFLSKIGRCKYEVNNSEISCENN